MRCSSVPATRPHDRQHRLRPECWDQPGDDDRRRRDVRGWPRQSGGRAVDVHGDRDVQVGRDRVHAVRRLHQLCGQICPLGDEQTRQRPSSSRVSGSSTCRTVRCFNGKRRQLPPPRNFVLESWAIRIARHRRSGDGTWIYVGTNWYPGRVRTQAATLNAVGDQQRQRQRRIVGPARGRLLQRHGEYQGSCTHFGWSYIRDTRDHRRPMQ